ncbi:MAG TPA: YggT family protein [Actinomycetales bacterium]
MDPIRAVLHFIVLIFFVLLIGRVVIDWIQVLARDWRPRGVVLVIAEAIFTVTDPPLRALRRLVPPLRIGQIQIDLAFMILFFATLVLLNLLS